MNGLEPLVNWDEVTPVPFDVIDPTHTIRVRWAVHTGHANAIMKTDSAFVSCNYSQQHIDIACKSDEEAETAFRALMAWFDNGALFIVRHAVLATSPDELGRVKELARHSMFREQGGAY